MSLRLHVMPEDEGVLRARCPVLIDRDRAAALAVGEELARLLEPWKAFGLAAPQVGSPLRVFAYRTPEMKAPVIAVNPVLRLASVYLERREEGCLSLPGLFATIWRPADIDVAYVDVEHNRLIELSLHDFEARVFQHELDHLEGVLFTDHLPHSVGEKKYCEYLDRRHSESTPVV